MRRALHHSVAALAILAGVFNAKASRAGDLVNGNIEQGPAIPQANPIYAVAPGNTALTGWTVTGGAVSIVTDGYWVPLSGHRSLALSSTGAGSIEQSVATAAGSTYRITFWMSGEPFSSPTIKHLRVTAGAEFQDFTFDTTPAWHWDMAWTQHTMEFTAGGASTTVRFSSMDASQWGPAIDSTKVELVSTGVGTGGAVLAFAPVIPDPVSASGRFAFTLATDSRVRLSVHDIQGREIARLVDGERPAGPMDVEFSPSAHGMRPGLYLAVLQAGGRRLVRRFTVIL